MKEKTHNELLSYALRIAVGSLLFVMGVSKFSGGVEAFVTNTMTMFDGTLMPMGLAKAYLTVVPLLEVVIGGLLILGLFTSVAAWIGSFMFALFVVGLALTGKPEMHVMITSNFIYLFASAWLAKLPAGHLSIDYVIGGEK